VEIPIDIQQALIDMPGRPVAAAVAVLAPRSRARRAGRALAKARRPLLWLGGGARHAGAAVQRLKALGFGIVSTGQGLASCPRTIQPPWAPTTSRSRRGLYQRCDAMLAVGTRLRSNETLKYELKLRARCCASMDAAQQGRCYMDDGFVCGDSALALNGLADRLEARGYKADPELLADLRQVHDEVVPPCATAWALQRPGAAAAAGRGPQLQLGA
jgi:acetolactate synthase-1/2/3 large subunit